MNNPKNQLLHKIVKYGYKYELTKSADYKSRFDNYVNQYDILIGGDPNKKTNVVRQYEFSETQIQEFIKHATSETKEQILSFFSKTQIFYNENDIILDGSQITSAVKMAAALLISMLAPNDQIPKSFEQVIETELADFETKLANVENNYSDKINYYDKMINGLNILLLNVDQLKTIHELKQDDLEQMLRNKINQISTKFYTTQILRHAPNSNSTDVDQLAQFLQNLQNVGTIVNTIIKTDKKQKWSRFVTISGIRKTIMMLLIQIKLLSQTLEDAINTNTDHADMFVSINVLLNKSNLANLSNLLNLQSKNLGTALTTKLSEISQKIK